MTTLTTETQTDAGDAFPTGLPYTAYASFSAAEVRATLPREGRAAAAAAALEALGEIDGVALRGTYDTSGYRSDVDLLVWLAGPSYESLQDSLAALRRSAVGRALTPFWSAIGTHREAEFNRSHVPAFFAGEPARRYLCAYPFVRTLEWYLLEPEERRRLLAAHGKMARGYPDVRANTVSAFGLGDYEWLLAFEADDPDQIVDLIRHLRGAEARLYTKHELPFIFGARKPLAEIIDMLP